MSTPDDGRRPSIEQRCKFLKSCLRDSHDDAGLPEFFARLNTFNDLSLEEAEEEPARLEIELKAADDGSGGKIINQARWEKFGLLRS